MNAMYGKQTMASRTERLARRTTTTWAELRAEIMKRIADGTYPVGSLIPTEKEFAAEFGCARATVNRALSALAMRGVLDRRRRIGTRVAMAPVHPNEGRTLPVVRERIERLGLKFNFDYVGEIDRPLPADVVDRLFRSDPDTVVETVTLYYGGDQLICAERRWHDTTLMPQLLPSLDDQTTANDWIAANVTLSQMEQQILAVTARTAEADRLLRCPPAAPVLCFETCAWIESTPASFARHVFLPGESLCTIAQ